MSKGCDRKPHQRVLRTIKVPPCSGGRQILRAVGSLVARREAFCPRTSRDREQTPALLLSNERDNRIGRWMAAVGYSLPPAASAAVTLKTSRRVALTRRSGNGLTSLGIFGTRII